MKNSKILIAISGCSGVGKSAAIDYLKKKLKDVVIIKSHTTRQRRSENDDYIFQTPESFEKLLLGGNFLEVTKYNNFQYGTPRTPVINALNSGKTVIVDLNYEGVKSLQQDLEIKSLNAPILSIFLIADAATLTKRLKNRGENQWFNRLKIATDEVQYLDIFDSIVDTSNLNTNEVGEKIFQIINDFKENKECFNDFSFDIVAFKRDVGNILKVQKRKF